jgi:isopenicillin N synthase-like dioxygenase
MSNYSNPQPYPPPGGNNPAAPPAKKNCFKKGLGFVPNSICKSESDPISTMLKAAPTMTKGQFTSTLDASSYESGSTIPLIDIEKIAVAKGEERSELIQSFGIALAQVGFVGIKAESLMNLIRSVYDEMGRYFRQSFDTKLLNWKKSEIQNGFNYRGCETGPKALRPDFKESFFITRDFNEWPSNFSSFPRIMSEYHSVLTEINKYLMIFLMEYLEQPQEDDEGIANHVLRLAYYPAFKPGDDPKGTWVAPHKDKNVLSIFSNGTVPGLQYYSRKGLWEPVVVPEGYLIVTTGLLLQHKTAGLIQARWHRVVNPGGKYTRLERYSTVFYGTWSDEYSLKPFANCVEKTTRSMPASRKEEYMRKYTDCTVAEKLSQRIASLV